MKIRMRLTGIRPMLFNNARLANPLDAFTKQLYPYTHKGRQTTDDDRLQAMLIEARGGCYEDDEGNMGLPYDMVYASFLKGAMTFRTGPKFKKAIIMPVGCATLLLPKKPISCDDYVTIAGNIDYRSAKPPGQGRVMRARPLIALGWNTVIEFEMNEEFMDLRDLLRAGERAGAGIGFGNWTPRYGLYTVEAL